MSLNLEMSELDGGRVIEFAIFGKLTDADYKRFVRVTEQGITQFGTIGLAKQVETTYSAYQPVGVSPGSSGRFASGGGKPGLTPIGSLSFTERIFHTCL